MCIRDSFRIAGIINMSAGELYMPGKEDIQSKDLIVCTTMTAGRFVYIIIYELFHCIVIPSVL